MKQDVVDCIIVLYFQVMKRTMCHKKKTLYLGLTLDSRWGQPSMGILITHKDVMLETHLFSVFLPFTHLQCFGFVPPLPLPVHPQVPARV